MKQLARPQVFIDFDHPAVMRAMILHILEHAHLQGQDSRGRTIMRFEFPVEDWMIDKLACFGSELHDLEFDPEEDDDDDGDLSLVESAEPSPSVHPSSPGWGR